MRIRLIKINGKWMNMYQFMMCEDDTFNPIFDRMLSGGFSFTTPERILCRLRKL